MPSQDLSDHIRQLEERLLDPEIRRVPEEAARFLADEFVEFGSSGRRFTQPEAVAALSKDTPGERLRISNFHLTVLGPNAVLATYRIEAGPSRRHLSLRSSVWVLRSGSWQVLFHQGTPTSGP